MSSAPQPGSSPLSHKARQQLAAAGGLFVLICMGAWFAVDKHELRRTPQPSAEPRRPRYPDLEPRRLPDSTAVWQRSAEAAESSYGTPRPPRPIRPALSQEAQRQQLRAMLQKEQLMRSTDDPPALDFSSPNFSFQTPPFPVETERTLAASVLELVPVRDDGDVWFYGVLKNTGDGPLEHPRINVSMLNEDKTEVVGTTYGFAERFVLNPNEVTPFRVLGKSAPPFAHATATVDLQAAASHHKPVKLRIVQHTLTPQSSMMLLSGTIKNTGDQPLQFVQVIALARDKQGRPIGYASAYASAKRLKPGASAPFSSFFFLSRKPAHIDFDFDGTPTN